MVINAETPNWTMCGKWETLEKSALKGCLYHSSVQDSGIYNEEEAEKLEEPELMDNTKEAAFSGNNMAVEHMNSQILFIIHKTCTPSSQTKSQPSRSEVGMKSHP